MSEPSSTGESRPASEKVGERIGSTANDPAAPKKLTAEEQMALYENSLKEEDWGHQPC